MRRPITTEKQASMRFIFSVTEDTNSISGEEVEAITSSELTKNNKPKDKSIPRVAIVSGIPPSCTTSWSLREHKDFDSGKEECNLSEDHKELCGR
ncbi:hypothetical protein Peur_013455 [Populus x canadensis]